MTENSLWEKEQEMRRTCMLMITHKCNLNCSYFYEGFKSDKDLIRKGTFSIDGD